MAVGAESLTDDIVHELQRRILLGEIPRGTWIRHQAVAEEFGTSRTPIREALRVLHAQGVVTIVPNRGARVNGRTGLEVRELGQVRAELEALAARLAATRITDEGLDILERALIDFERLVADEDRSDAPDEPLLWWVEANEAFHSTVIGASGNAQLAAALEDIGRRLPANSSFTVYRENSYLLERNLREHQAVHRALRDRDADAAVSAMRDHVLSSAAALADWVERS